MQRLEVSGAVRPISIHIWVIRRQTVNSLVHVMTFRGDLHLFLPTGKNVRASEWRQTVSITSFLNSAYVTLHSFSRETFPLF